MAVATDQQRPSKIEEHEARELVRDERVQRALSEQHVNKLMANLNLDVIGTVVVSKRNDGKLIVLDGGHRVTALMRSGHDKYKVRCIVHTDLTPAQEAELFLGYNERNIVNIHERFRIAVVAKDPDAVMLDKILREEGFQVQPNTHNSLMCIGTLMDVYRGSSKNSSERHPEVAKETLSILNEAWGTEGSAVKETVYGIGAFLLEFDSKVDREHLVNKLVELRGGPAALKAEAGQLRDLRLAKTLREGAMTATMNVYNHGLRGNRVLKLG